MRIIWANDSSHKDAQFVLCSCPVSLISFLLLFHPQLGHGDYSAASTKVLRMVNTLAVDNEAKQTIEALQTELQKTKEKLQAVEELKSQTGIKALFLE